ncbi:P-loop containing nucleoside triphosphate hydrolase protein [Globomyces pollinis-pini]|nr:P-loop containing nucleoside triphosphate hydrolase protein [Globomyces pollinis-pini]
MSLWVDKYRPNSLRELDYHDSITEKLHRLSNSKDFPHLLVYGPSGVGKKTRINAILNELYGVHFDKLKVELKQFTTPSNKKLEINVISSNYHIEITPSDLGIYDQVVIQDLIKELAQTRQIDSNSKHKFKIVVFNEADSLSRNAQSALRRTMEKYMGNMRVILCCNMISKILGPIRSRCLLVRIPAPAEDEMCDVLLKCAKYEKLSLPQSIASKIAIECDGNMRKALLMLEAHYVQQYPFEEGKSLPTTDWELYLNNIVQTILRDQSPKSLYDIRGKLYQLLANCIPANVIIKNLTMELLRNVDSDLQPQIVAAAAEYEHRMQIGSKKIFHLEAFIAKVMSVYSQYLIDFAG